MDRPEFKPCFATYLHVAMGEGVNPLPCPHWSKNNHPLPREGWGWGERDWEVPRGP